MSSRTVRIMKAIIANAAPADKEYILWDSEVRKLGLRVLPTGRKSFVFQYRMGRVSKKLTIGPGDLSLTIVRALALEAAGKVAGGIDPGKERDDLRNRITMAELVERFDASHIEFHVKSSTAKEYRRAIQLYILPAFGRMHVGDITRSQIHALHQKMKDKPTQANRTLEILSKMFNLAEEWGCRDPNTNPRKGIKKNIQRQSGSGSSAPPSWNAWARSSPRWRQNGLRCDRRLLRSGFSCSRAAG